MDFRFAEVRNAGNSCPSRVSESTWNQSLTVCRGSWASLATLV
jgi:hypothetical protein